MIWKLLGAIFIFFASFIAGHLATIDLICRPKQLASLQRGILALETEISYGSTPLPKAFQQAASQAGELQDVFLDTAQKLQIGNGFTAGEAWQDVLLEKAKALSLKKEDLHIALLMGENLGLSDGEDQLKRLTLLRARLHTQEEFALKEKDKLVKVWQSLSVAIGFALILILF